MAAKLLRTGCIHLFFNFSCKSIMAAKMAAKLLKMVIICLLFTSEL